MPLAVLKQEGQQLVVTQRAMVNLSAHNSQDSQQDGVQVPQQNPTQKIPPPTQGISLSRAHLSAPNSFLASLSK